METIHLYGSLCLLHNYKKSLDYVVMNLFRILCILSVIYCCCVGGIHDKESIAHADFNSLTEYVNKTRFSLDIDVTVVTWWGRGLFVMKLTWKFTKLLINCESRSVGTSVSDFNNMCMPYYLSNDRDIQDQICSDVGDFKPHFMMPSIGSFVAKFIMCLGTYVISPYEYVLLNFEKSFLNLKEILFTKDSYTKVTPCGWRDHQDNKCSTGQELHFTSSSGSKKVMEYKEHPGDGYIALRPDVYESDVPFFYKCSSGSGYETISELIVKCNPFNTNGGDEEHCRGLLSSQTEYCSKRGIEYAWEDVAHKIVVASVKFIKMFQNAVGMKDDFSYNLDGHTFMVVDPAKHNFSKSSEKGSFKAFYKLAGDRIKLCVAKESVMPMPMVIGCTLIPPPIEDISVNLPFENLNAIDHSYLGGCRAMLPQIGRRDLYALGSSGQIFGNATDHPVALFLKSDFHFFSTIYSCINGLVTFVMTHKDDGMSFMDKIQKAMSTTIFVVLSMYVVLLGFRIAFSPQHPTIGDGIIYIIKFVVVLYVAVGMDVTYRDSHNQTITVHRNIAAEVIYPTVINGMEGIMKLFMRAQDASGNAGMCSYDNPSTGQNILLSSNIATVYDAQGDKWVVKTNVWDYIDCLLISYLNFGACKFTSEAMLPLLFIALMFTSILGLLMGIVSIIYFIMLLLLLLKFFHLTILSIFAVAVLVIAAPIMVSFILFDQTKRITTQWFKMLLSYMLYPGMLFAFLFLILVTINSVFYGPNVQDALVEINRDTNMNISEEQRDTYIQQLKSACGEGKAKASVYCFMLYSTNLINGCGESLDVIRDILIAPSSVKLLFINLFVVYQIKPGTFDLFISMIKLVFIMIIFYSLVSAITTFIETLLSLIKMSDHAKLGDILTNFVKIAAKKMKKDPTVDEKSKDSKKGGDVSAELNSGGGGDRGGGVSAELNTSSGGNEG